MRVFSHGGLTKHRREWNTRTVPGLTIEQLHDKATSAVQMNGSMGEWFRKTVAERP